MQLGKKMKTCHSGRLQHAFESLHCQRALDSKGSAAASHLGSGSRSMRRLPTMGLMDRSDGCQMSCSIVGWPGVVFRNGAGTAGPRLSSESPDDQYIDLYRVHADCG